MRLSRNDLDFVINHVVLPPKLPQREDREDQEREGEKNLFSLVYETVSSFVDKCDPIEQEAWSPVLLALTNWRKVIKEGSICRNTFSDVLSNLQQAGAVALHIKAQNAGLILRKSLTDEVIVDAFEASPSCESVIESRDRLVRIFPGRSVTFPSHLLQEPSFIKEFSMMVYKLSHEHVELCKQTTKKAHSTVPEERDTANPALVTENLMSILQALGDAHESQTIQKHTRDEVNWNHSKLPWRRSPFWLVLRITIQTLLVHTFPADKGHHQYKNLMAFLMAKVCEIALNEHVSPDIQTIISTKAARRLAKLGSNALKFVTEFVRVAIERARDDLELSWTEFQNEDSRVIPDLNRLASDKDNSLFLRNSQKYLREIMEEDAEEAELHQFQPSPGPQLRVGSDGLPHLEDFKNSPDKHFALIDFEEWVMAELRPWMNGRRACEHDCQSVFVKMRVYVGMAQCEYQDNPRAMSTMLLVMMELWTVLDIMFLKLYPVVSRFSPEIAVSIMEPLLLPHFCQMEQLKRIEDHLLYRHSNADWGSPRILADPCEGSFAVWFFEQSKKHRYLKERIEKDAMARRQRKEEEWAGKSDLYHRLMREESVLDHSFSGIDRYDIPIHSSDCRKCRLIKQANSISIRQDEWPLPADPIQLRTAVFELDCPQGFSAWRDATWMILHKLGRDRSSRQQESEQQLLSYDLLESYASDHGQNLSLCSYTKSFLRTHYRELYFPVSLDSVCVANGLSYKLFDKERTAWIVEQKTTPTFHPHCITLLPSGLYSNLQDFVDKSSHSPNEAIARQQECHPKLSPHEFIAFASLRAGERLQWLNTLRELGSADLAFNSEEFHILVRQAALQAGTRNEGNVLRESHMVLERIKFRSCLLDVLHNQLETIEANWKEQNRLAMLATLGLRILSLTMEDDMTARTVQFLRKLRGVGLAWCRQITDLLPSCPNEERGRRLRESILKTAIACRVTFHIDPWRIAVTLENDGDVENMIELSIYLHDNSPIRLEDLSMETKHALLLDKRISRINEPRLKALINESSNSINRAIFRVCGIDVTLHPWQVLPRREGDWVINETALRPGHGVQQVQYNLLTGELLLNGEPIGRLPAAYIEMPIYRRVFGSRVLNVSCSDLPKMRYKSTQKINGNEVHLGMEDNELLIKANSDGRCLRIIPHEVFKGDIPVPLTEDFVHWMDTNTSTIEFRPLKSPWEKPSKSLVLSFSPNGKSYMNIGKTWLVDSCSNLGKSVIGVLEVIESANHILITTSEEKVVEASLPRFGLKFFINGDGVLESKDLAAVVEKCQTIGCMFGLRNKLVLRDANSHLDLRERSVLIPYGSVVVHSGEKFRIVEIQTGSDRNARFMHYQLDATLSKLGGGPGAMSTLYRAYLHAVTSSALPDPFTSHTGTQEALRILCEQALLTSLPLDEETMFLLNMIASLTPRRVFYPRHLRRMQTVEWDSDLCQLAQHENFDVLAQQIVSHAARFGMLHGGHSETSNMRSRGDPHLLDRASARNFGMRNTCLGAHSHNDEAYNSRDANWNTARASRVHDLALLVRRWPSRINVVQDLTHAVRQWGHVSGYGRALTLSTMSCTDLLELSLGKHWGSLYDFCRYAQKGVHSYSLMFLFGTITFSEATTDTILRTLLGIAFSNQCKDIMPEESEFNLEMGEQPDHGKLQSVIGQHCKPFQEHWLENHIKRQERLATYDRDKRDQISLVTSLITSQWPRDTPIFPALESVPLIKVCEASRVCTDLFKTWNKNRKFILHIDRVQKRLKHVHTPYVDLGRLNVPVRTMPSTETECAAIAPDMMKLLKDRTPPSLQKPSNGIKLARAQRSTKLMTNLTQVHHIIDGLRATSNNTRNVYADDVESSLDSFKNTEMPETPNIIPVRHENLLDHRSELLDVVSATIRDLEQALGPTDSSSQVLHRAGLWPRIETASLLAFLSTKTFRLLSTEWQRTLVHLGETIALLQRSERLLNLLHRKDVVGFYKESEEPGRQNWKAINFPDWLLIEIENNLTIRQIQTVVALRLIFASTNSVLQLNMGEGKSSVIIPMVLTVLADKSQIARLIVLKPLLRQTEYLLAQRLGGLVNRRIYHTPFSRTTCLDESQIISLQRLYAECMEEQGVLITIPEHVLSFRLMGRERLCKQPSLAMNMISLEHWLGRHCRDVLDESDEILDSRFQLVYSVGSQQMMDGQPDRWVVTQAVLSLFAQQAVRMQTENSTALDIDCRDGSYPFISFLDPVAGGLVLHEVVEEIGRGSLIGVSFGHCTSSIRNRVLQFIRERSLAEQDFGIIKREFSGTVMWGKLLLLRGLVAYNILLFAFKNKRWLVNYGLDLKRCMMAVPYRAKGVPSISAVFGHPDVAIVLTCLSYYYGGLTSEQLRLSFDLLMRESDPPSEYARWVRSCPKLPKKVHNLQGVNLEDEELWASDVLPYLRLSKAAADFFMSRVVFPHEGKEFPKKLSSSAWDIPSQPHQNITTGFSGTNDNKFLLPTPIQQHDLQQLHHTNAMMVDLLLQEENRAYIQATDGEGKRLRVEDLLRLICNQEHRIQVLIDVGAQVLESKNQDGARDWLRLSTLAKAAVFFDESDELMVIDHEGYVERLFSSPYRHRLDSCLIYLDEIHTRGVNLSMPACARAAVTLGPRMTKDRLVQACMRMRKLGCHQFVVFFAPSEVHRDILKVTNKEDNSQLGSADVIRWCFEQTCRGLDTMKPLWLSHGLEYCRRKRLISEFLEDEDHNIRPEDPDAISAFYSHIQEPEGRPLEEMYGISAAQASFRSCLIDDAARRDPMVQHLVSSGDSLNGMDSRDWILQEEQEREIAHEVEQERELQKPPPAKELPHTLHPHVRRFVNVGTFEHGHGSPFLPAFEGLRETSAYQHLNAELATTNVYVTTDFVATVEIDRDSTSDQFIRPVKWILSGQSPNNLVIISPYEANALLPEITTSSKVTLHMYSAKTSKSMHSFSSLDFYNITNRADGPNPSRLSGRQLDVFAGSLFLDSYTCYQTICQFLGIVTTRQAEEMGIRIEHDGFANREARKRLNWLVSSPFDRSPLPFLRAFFGIRRKGQLYSQTHMGHLLSGHFLNEETFSSV